MGGDPAEGADLADQVRQSVASIRRKVLGDTDGGKEIRVGGSDFLWCGTVVEFADQARDPFGDERIRVAAEAADIGFKRRHQPEVGGAAFDEESVELQVGRQGWGGLGAVDHVLEAFVMVGKRFELRDELVASSG